MAAAVWLGNVPAATGASFTKYEDWLRNLLGDTSGQNLRVPVTLALQDLLRRQDAKIVNSNVKVLLSATLKLKQESRDYVQSAKDVRGDVTRLPSEAAKEPKESIEDLLRSWEIALSTKGKLPNDVRQKKFLHPHFFTNKIIPQLLETAIALNSPSSKTFVKAFLDEKMISNAQYKSFLTACEPEPTPTPPHPVQVSSLVSPSAPAKRKPPAASSVDIKGLCSQIIAYMGAPVTHASSVDPIAALLQGYVSEATDPAETDNIAEDILMLFLAPSFAAPKLDVSFGSSSLGSPKGLSPPHSNTRLSIRQLRLFVLGVWKNPTLYSACVKIFLSRLNSAIFVESADLRPLAALFICLAGRLFQHKQDTDWCDRFFRDSLLTNAAALPRAVDFCVLLVRLAETGFGLVSTLLDVLDHHSFVSNPTLPKTNLYDDTIGASS
jgi:hypothetical protein